MRTLSEVLRGEGHYPARYRVPLRYVLELNLQQIIYPHKLRSSPAGLVDGHSANYVCSAPFRIRTIIDAALQIVIQLPKVELDMHSHSHWLRVKSNV